MAKSLTVRNSTRETVLVTQGQVAGDVWARFVGLMGKRELAPGYGLLLKNESAIHTFGMRIPIDVAYLDRQGVVLQVTEGMVPYRVGPLVRGVRDVLELPRGTLSQTKTCVGDQLEIVQH